MAQSADEEPVFLLRHKTPNFAALSMFLMFESCCWNDSKRHCSSQCSGFRAGNWCRCDARRSLWRSFEHGYFIIIKKYKMKCLPWVGGLKGAARPLHGDLLAFRCQVAVFGGGGGRRRTNRTANKAATARVGRLGGVALAKGSRFAIGKYLKEMKIFSLDG